jgi:hypothetical protein
MELRVQQERTAIHNHKPEWVMLTRRGTAPWDSQRRSRRWEGFERDNAPS